MTRILIDEEIEMEIANYLLCFLDKLTKLCPKFNYINNIYLENIKKLSTKELENLQSQYTIHKNIWKIANTYRLMTYDKYDEESIWYVMDELGTYINHSDRPNFIVAPFIFSKSNQFKDDMITYSIMWPIHDIYAGAEVTKDFLLNINENMQRSARLTTWFRTPREYFLGKFEENTKKIEKLTKNSKNFLESYEKNILELKNLIYSDNSKNEISEIQINDEIDKIFNFKQLELKSIEENLDFNIIKNKIKKNITDSFLFTLKEKSEINNENVLKVFSDLSYVRENLKLKNFEITQNIDEADILWLNFDYFTLKANNKINCQEAIYAENEKPLITLKKIHFKNQFPFENIITHKSHIMNLLQDK